jgi:hypothetical protein
MGESATALAAGASGEPKRGAGQRSDGGSVLVGYLGDFSRGPALFTVYRLEPDQSRYPNGSTVYLVDCDDGVGPHEVCRFTDEDSEVVWNRAWNGDEWCDWIMERARAFVAEPRRH